MLRVFGGTCGVVGWDVEGDVVGLGVFCRKGFQTVDFPNVLGGGSVWGRERWESGMSRGVVK